MDLEVLRCKKCNDDSCWRVEYGDDEGCCYIAIFSGPDAEARAKEYYNFKWLSDGRREAQLAQRDATIRSLRDERIRKLKEAGHRVNDALQARLPFNSIDNTWAKALAADAKEGEGK